MQTILHNRFFNVPDEKTWMPYFYEFETGLIHKMIKLSIFLLYLYCFNFAHGAQEAHCLVLYFTIPHSLNIDFLIEGFFFNFPLSLLCDSWLFKGWFLWLFCCTAYDYHWCSGSYSLMLCYFLNIYFICTCTQIYICTCMDTYIEKCT